MTSIAEFTRQEGAAFVADLDNRLTVLDVILSENPGPWQYTDLVRQLIEKAGEPDHSYPAHPIDVLIKDKELVSQGDGSGVVDQLQWLQGREAREAKKVS